MIKLFEEYNQYYIKISQEEYNMSTIYHPAQEDEYEDDELFNKNDMNFLQKNWIDFTQSEISTLHDLMPKSSYKINPYTNGDRRIPKASIEYKDELNRIIIIKMIDEWYYVNYRGAKNSHYKCDQFEGLLKCIKDITIL